MGLKKAETAAILVTLLFAALTVGFRWGQRSVPTPFTVRTAPAGTVATERRRVNINTATLEELSALPGVGESLARRILEDREENGPFPRIEDITRVSGIGSGTLQTLWDQITVE